MKKTIFTTATFAFAALFASAQFKVFSTGKTAAGSTTTPNQALDVTGDVSLVNTTNAFRINNNYMLWNNGKTGCIYLGGGGSASNTGTYNTFVGFESGKVNTSSGDLTFVGASSGKANTAASNSFFGAYSGYTNNTGSGNSFFGWKSGYSNTTGADGNSFFGHNSGYSNSLGENNVAVGLAAGYYNATGSNNTSCGYGAGFGVVSTNHHDNSFYGYKAGYKITYGNGNVFSGVESGFTNNSGGYNVFLGYRAGYLNSTTSFNTAVGTNAGNGNATCSYSTFLGCAANATGDYSNCMALGSNASTNNTNDIVLGDGSIQYLRCNATLTGLSDGRVKNEIKENVPGLSFIKLLKPVTYHLNIHEANSIRGYPSKKDSTGNIIGVDTVYWQGKYDGEKTLQTGFVAQQVDSAAQQVGYDFNGVYKPKDEHDLYGLGYSLFVVPLVKAVQELSATVDSLQKAVANCCSKGATYRIANSDEQGNAPSIHELELANTTVLFQNYPNPFGDGTTIKYFIPDNIANAQIIFLDEFGSKLREFKVEEKGMGQLNITATNLSTGMYSYSLIVNGKVIDTKKMMRIK